MPSLSPSAIDSGVRVVVTPSQSSYFAGEPFAVTITFTNTRSPQSGPSRPNTHKRGAHSISSAPIARPPTSPGTLRTSVTPASTQPKSREDVSTKKGLVGKSFSSKGEDELPELIEQRRKKLLAKSLSVSIPPHELEQIGEGVVPKSASFVQKTFDHHLRVRAYSLYYFLVLDSNRYFSRTSLTPYIITTFALRHLSIEIKPPSCSKTICARWPSVSRVSNGDHNFANLALHPQSIIVDILPRSGPNSRRHNHTIHLDTFHRLPIP